MRRGTLIVSGVALATIAVGVFFFLYRPTGSPGVTFSAGANNHELSPAVIPFTKIAQGMRSTVSARANYIVTSSGELTDLWELIDATTPLPEVDFRKDAVIAVFAGTEPVSAITVAKIEDTNERMVSIAITKPDGTCAKEQTASSPYEVIVVPVSSLPVGHEDILTTASCTEN